MSNSYDCKLFSHTSYAMQTNHHHHNHHTYKSPKQNYSAQLSHTSNNDNVVLTRTKIITAITLKNFFTCLVCDWPSTHKIPFLPSILYKTHPLWQAGYK